MKLRALLARAHRLQQGTRFKVIASLVVLGLIAGAFIALLVAANAPGADVRIAQRASERAKEVKSGIVLHRGPIRAVTEAVDSLLLTIHPIEGRPLPETPGAEPAPAPSGASAAGAIRVGAVFLVVAAALGAIIWLGLGLSYLALFVIGWGVAWPLMLWGPTAGVGQLIFAAAPLVLAFLTGMTLLKLALSGSSPVMAVARNLLNEAVRMKVSLVFIIMLIVLLSYVPGALNENQPLRYRVQQWLQYGTGLSYMVLAFLTLFLSAGTVAFEQRDKVIWQTMTKPVAPWQYLLGKWLGVMGLNAVLLTVTAGGVYLFTEYLRHLPAQGEMAFHVRTDGLTTLGRADLMTEDRRLLESQVLVAREGRPMSTLMGEELIDRAIEEQVARMREADQSVRDTPQMRREQRATILEARQEQLTNAIDARLRDIQASDPTLRPTERQRYDIQRQIVQEQESLYRNIPPGTGKVYLFSGLSRAKAPGAPEKVTLRYRINAGANDPSAIYRVRFILNSEVIERQVALGAAQTLLFDKSLIDESGAIVLELQSASDNPRELSLPPGGLEVLYVAGGYEINFLRIMLVLWMKLGFTAAVAIAAATFVSFPVACLIAMTVLLSAESAGYLTESLEYYVSRTKDGIDYFAVLVRVIAVPISRIFKVYADLQPSANLVDGRLVGWNTLLSAMGVIGTWTASVLAIGWAIFRKRELATYSGK